MNTEQSEQLFAQSLKKIPGGVNSPVRAFRAVGRNPLFIKNAKGCQITDVDGNSYIDYVCSWGPGILGHAHPAVTEAAVRACREGMTFGAPTEKELILAEMLCEAVPSMDKVRLVNSGTEAVMSAVRAARGYTGRDYIIKFQGNYHGHSDGLLVRAGSGALTTAAPDSSGVPEGIIKYTLVADYNREESVKELMEQYEGKIAAVLVEPVAANMGVVPPEDGFLPFLRSITEQYGAVLIFDEVITGFRLGYGGAQEYFGVTPDMTVLGKIIGGGMPLAAYGGKKEIMDLVSPAGSVYQAGTLSGNPVATAAGIETLKQLKAHPEYYQQIGEAAEKIAETLRQTAKEKKYPLWVNQIGSLLCAFHTENPVRDFESAFRSDTKAYARYFNRMLEGGVYLAPSQFEAMFVSVAHTPEIVEQTCQVIRELKEECFTNA